MEWADAFEQRFGQAHAEGDLTTCLSLLRVTELALPVPPEGQFALLTVTGEDGRVWLPAYTSPAAMKAASGGGEFRVWATTLVELAAAWPDPEYGLAVNAGLPESLFLEPGTVARLAVPTMAQDRTAEPEAGIPVVQKPLTVHELYGYLAEGESRVSGYCHNAQDVEQMATPAVLIEALGMERVPGVRTEDGSIHLLRWVAIGANLYRTPYGGTDENGMSAVEGWVIEEPPFVGMGLVPGNGALVREYKIDSVRLPHGAEIVEVTEDGTERVRGVYDGDLDRWRSPQ